MDTSERVLELLYDRGEVFFAMDELSAASGLTRAALDTALDALQARGQQWEDSLPHGVRLVRPIRLNAYLIERDLGTSRVGRHAICFAEVDSTNDVAFDAARRGEGDGLVVLAESQRRGRGRHGRTWQSAPGDNLLFSVLLVDGDNRLGHEALTIAAGLATAEGIETACGIAARLKWPNDVLIDEGKVAGVLVEARAQKRVRTVVVGIGINVNSSPRPGETESPATDLAAHVGHRVERTEVIRAVLRRLEAWAERISAGDLAGLHDAWVARCGMIHQRVTVATGGKRHVGRILDVSPLEGLSLQCDDGVVLHLPAARATILK